MTLNTETQSQPEEKFFFRENAKESSAGLVVLHVRACMSFCLSVYVHVLLRPEANLGYGSSGIIHLVLLRQGLSLTELTEQAGLTGQPVAFPALGL